jgi:hypothetical protein
MEEAVKALAASNQILREQLAEMQQKNLELQANGERLLAMLFRLQQMIPEEKKVAETPSKEETEETTNLNT